MSKVYLSVKQDGAESGLPIIIVEIDQNYSVQQILQDCQKYLPYRLVEFKPNFNSDIVDYLINNGFEVIVNLDDVVDIRKISRSAKIRLTLDIYADFRGVENLAQSDEVKFLLHKEDDIELLKDILGKTLTRARLFIGVARCPDAELTKEKLGELMLANVLPASLEE